MNDITFITGNQSKADYLAKYLGFPVTHTKLHLDELQSLELKEIVEHKVRQAYELAGKPVIVEDVSLEFSALGKLPGPFIKFFVEEVPLETICRMVDGMDRKAIGRCMFGYFDGTDLKFFEGQLDGEVAQHPAGENGFGWDKIFVPDGFDVTRASLDDDDYKKLYLQIKPFEQLKQFFEETAAAKTK